VSGDPNKAKNSQKIHTLNFISGEAEQNVSSDSDDEKYLNVFKEKNEEQKILPENEIEKISAIHKEINRDFYLRYLDFLMRMLYTGKTSPQEQL
jgi:hypothetical protein